MSTKTLLIILVLIAILVGVAIWREQRHQEKDKKTTQSNTEHPPGENFFLFKWLQNGGGGFNVARVVGCNRNGNTLSFTGTCNARIMQGKARQSRFELKRITAGPVWACYGFSVPQLDSCQANDQRGELKTDKKNRFVATKDEAFLRLFCGQPTSACVVTVDSVSRH